MRIFLDTSVILAGVESVAGASRYVLSHASRHGWTLVVSPYVLEEVTRNLAAGSAGRLEWFAERVRRFEQVADVLTLDRIAVVPASKDRPVLFTAFESCEVLLTLDRKDFDPLGDNFYTLRIRRPGQFMSEERAAGRLIEP